MNERNYQLITFTEDGLSLDVRVDVGKETVWLTQAEMAELFGIERPVVLYHLRTIYRNEKLSEETTCTNIVQVQSEAGRAVKRERPIYKLDVPSASIFATSTGKKNSKPQLTRNPR